MGFLADRFKDRVVNAGELLTFTKLAGGAAGTAYAFVYPLDSGSLNVYLDDVEKMGVVKPGLRLVLPGDSTVILNDTFTREGRTYTIQKAPFFDRRGIEVVSKVCIAA